MLKLEKKIKRLSGVDFLSTIEIWSIILQTILFIFLYMPFISGVFRSIIMFIVLFLCLVQILSFFIRRTKFDYLMNYKIYLILVLSHLFLFLGVVTYLYKIKSLTIFIEIVSIGWLIIFFTIGLLNFKISAKYIFYWRLKSIFPSEGAEIYEIEVSLKKLAPYISLEKQKAYLIIRYGIKFITYGFYTYLCLLVFKIAEFIPVLEKAQNYLINWGFINASNAISLFSIFIALLTICVPVQQKIVREAEKEMLERYKI